MIHLTSLDHAVQPWKNGRGTTIEMWRLDRDGRMLARLSAAAVTEDGPFSIFPGVERNLTVLSGPGFRLTGDGLDLRCAPLVPVAFPGDVAVMASETMGQESKDFNVMTARGLPLPQVAVLTDTWLAAGGLLAIYALGPCRINGTQAQADDLILTDTAADLSGTALTVRLTGL